MSFFLSWLRTSGLPSLLLAIAYAFSGRLSFLAQVDDVLVTPVFFLPEGVALAFALRFGPGIWPGILAGQLALARHQGLPLAPALSISASNSLEALGAVWLYRRWGGQPHLYDLRSWIVLQSLIFFILQPFSATLGTLTLVFSGVIQNFPDWLTAWQSWWIGNAVAQSQLTPLLLLLMNRESRAGWAKKILFPLAMTAAALGFTLHGLPVVGIGASLALFQPLLVGFGLALGLKAVCAASTLTSLTFLYATSHAIGPFYFGENTNLLDLNVFLVGISLIGQFLAVLFRRLQEKQREMATRNEDIRLVTEGAGIGFWSRDLRTGLEEWDDITRKLKTSLTAAGIAHEINQPLSQILLQSELSLRQLAASPDSAGGTREAFRNIQERTKQVVETSETIRALLGNVASEHQKLDLTDVVRSAVLYLQPGFQRAGIQLQPTGLESPRTMTGDDAQLHLMVSNLLRNALQAVEKGPVDRKKISLSLKESPEGLLLSVEDSGPGFSPEQQLASELPIESTKPEGMGMGLFLVRTAVENHRGRITFSRSPSLGGASVTVTFPK